MAGESDGVIMTKRRSSMVAVFGAYGHTARFVAAEFHRRGIAAILSGRDQVKLDLLGPVHPDSDLRVASIEDPASLDRALEDANIVINCAGPFGETAPALIEAALRARCHYLDVTGEALVTIETFARYAESELDVKRVRDAGIVLVPSMAFYGALGDLLATVALGDWAEADDISMLSRSTAGSQHAEHAWPVNAEPDAALFSRMAEPKCFLRVTRYRPRGGNFLRHLAARKS